MNQIAVDIVVPTYKRNMLLRETLKSIQDQNCTNWQCWIAEDGETQETRDAISPFLEDTRYIYLPWKHVGFPAGPRNRAIRKGSAKYVAILDDDDLWLPEKLERQLQFFESHPACVLLGCNAYRWKGDGNWRTSPLYFENSKSEKIGYQKLLRQNHIIHSSAILERTALEKAGLYNETLKPPIGEDYELWLRIGALGEIWALAEPYMVYRETPQTYYPKLNRSDNYRTTANLFDSALKGTGHAPSPLSYPENAPFAAACRRERNFYLAGPRFLGRFRHELASQMRTILNPY
jgi:glycosyltransferase involved in cell wall biosynthesis